MSLSGDKGVAQFKKSVKMEHPNESSTSHTLKSQTSYQQNAAGDQESEPKLSAVGSNFPNNKTWKHLISLSLSEKRPKSKFLAKSG